MKKEEKDKEEMAEYGCDVRNDDNDEVEMVIDLSNEDNDGGVDYGNNIDVDVEVNGNDYPDDDV